MRPMSPSKVNGSIYLYPPCKAGSEGSAEVPKQGVKVPEETLQINIDKSGANKAGIRIYNHENRKRIKI